MNKNLFLFAAAAALTFTACSDNDDMTASRDGSLSSNETTAVQFSTYLAGQQTRAGQAGSIVNGATETNSLGKLGFGVFAYNTGSTDWTNDNTTENPDFMYNQKVSSDDGSDWTYTPIKYWPNDFTDGDVDAGQGTNGEENNATGANKGGKVSFFAYAPFVEASSYATASQNLKYGTDGAAVVAEGITDEATITGDGILGMTFNTYKGAPRIRYSLKSTKASENVDLLWGTALKKNYNTADGKGQTLTTDYNVNLTKQAVNEKIGFSFKHALAKLGGNTNNSTNTTEEDKDYGKVKIVLDIDDGGTDASTAITGGTKADATLVTVNSITIQDAHSWLTANPSQTKYTTLTETSYKYRKSGWFNLATGTWEAGEEADYVQGTKTNTYVTTISKDGDGTSQTKLKMNTDIAEPASVSATNGAWDASVTVKGVTTTPKSVYAAATSDGDNLDPGILMIPDGATAQPFVVTVDYNVRTADSHLDGGYSYANQVITNVVSIPAGALAPNKVYSLLIHLGLTSVKFEAQVADWENADGTTTSGSSTGEGNQNTENQKDIYLPSNTLAATTASTKSIEATATTATIDITNLTEGYTVEVSKVEKNGTETSNISGTASYTSSASSVQSDGKATVTISGTDFTANTSTTDAVVYTVTINVKNAKGEVVQTLTVTITQAAAE